MKMRQTTKGQGIREGEGGAKKSEDGDEDGDEGDNDVYEEDENGEDEDEINTEDQYPGDRKDGEEDSEMEMHIMRMMTTIMKETKLKVRKRTKTKMSMICPMKQHWRKQMS